jgi:hypothetical protein
MTLFKTVPAINPGGIPPVNTASVWGGTETVGNFKILTIKIKMSF